ncbi:Kazal-type serine protease inhibitor domain [Popillia japonica]|uniref:Kazal-type serine protease inhibitor domain n=1 Tax=Popillia japonica TaxID=7064 RepID=A0AAW1J1C5_POPJA
MFANTLPALLTYSLRAIKEYSNQLILKKLPKMKNMGIVVFVLAFAICTTMVSANCAKLCTFDYRPVCGEDNEGNKQTYGNRCTLDVAACEGASKGIRYVSDGAC